MTVRLVNAIPVCSLVLGVSLMGRGGWVACVGAACLGLFVAFIQKAAP